MKKNISCKIIFFAVFSGFLFSSCLSVDIKTEAPVSVEYTEKDAVVEELKRIDEYSRFDIVKSYWYAEVVSEKYPTNEDVSLKLRECCSALINQLDEAIEAKDLFEAVRLYDSLEASGVAEASLRKESVKLIRKEIENKIPGLLNASDSEGKKVSDFIKGTVTVLVDKGIRIELGKAYNDMMLGSGFFISRDGYIVTNHHVISDCVDPKYEGTAKLYIKLAEDSDTKIPAKVVGYDSILDLALLKTEVDAPYYFTLGSSNDLEIGDSVFAIGSPLGLERTLTSGIISSVDRQLITLGRVFQIDAAVNSGNSGGPMIDKQGRVQAVVFAGVQNYQGLNFAIPVEYLRYDLPFLYKGGERNHSWTGCYGKTKKLPGSGTKNEGINVHYVMPGSSAWISGIREGDIIVGLNGIEVLSLDDFQNKLMSISSGTIVLITIEDEEGNRSVKKVYLDKRPENPGYSVYNHDIFQDASYPLFGMKLAAASAANRRTFSIVKVMKGSDADNCLFEPGDPLTVNKIEINKECDQIYIEFYGKRRKNGYLEVGMGITASLDSPFYF